MLMTILATVIVLGVLIFVHELGHFVTAKLVDIAVPRFSIGLGPRLWGFRLGETEYVISWLPLGGYVKMAGMEEMERIEGAAAERDGAAVAVVSDVGLVSEIPEPPDPREFEAKPLPVRALVISAGVLMNTFFAFAVFAASALVWGVAEVPEARIGRVMADRLPAGAEALASVPAGARVTAVDEEPVEDWRDLEDAILAAPAGAVTVHFDGAPPARLRLAAGEAPRSQLLLALQPARKLEPVIGAVMEDGPADRAGIEAGDRVLAVGDRPIHEFQELVVAVESSGGQPLALRVQRDGQQVSLRVVPEVQQIRGSGGAEQPIGRIGVASAVPRRQLGPFQALGYAAGETWGWVDRIVGFLGDLVTGEVSPRNLGGPILIGQLSGRVARAGLEQLLNFMAILSLNLAVLNLLPIPVLDGGHLLFLAVEGVRGRALSLEQRMRLTQAGLVIVLALMVWALASDVLRLFGL
ncbi:MAG: RIP metalloprotease RseP [Gemmatimonadetes bacterium]|nr:RIP metalloprotease RseP [Gemmatimonadota bacterium]